ncbi:hypothetical protein SDC9_95720 [bioreactor metagenome]|uniref:Uncharacterized protein n=1 Tax=bioreactor metagenome TaxID=1076179 RepID=A0A645ADS7_9ZZZZ
MDALSQLFLLGAELPQNQDGGVELGIPLGLLHQGLGLGRAGDDAVKGKGSGKAQAHQLLALLGRVKLQLLPFGDGDNGPGHLFIQKHGGYRGQKQGRPLPQPQGIQLLSLGKHGRQRLTVQRIQKFPYWTAHGLLCSRAQHLLGRVVDVMNDSPRVDLHQAADGIVQNGLELSGGALLLVHGIGHVFGDPAGLGDALRAGGDEHGGNLLLGGIAAHYVAADDDVHAVGLGAGYGVGHLLKALDEIGAQTNAQQLVQAGNIAKHILKAHHRNGGSGLTGEIFRLGDKQRHLLPGELNFHQGNGGAALEQHGLNAAGDDDFRAGLDHLLRPFQYRGGVDGVNGHYIQLMPLGDFTRGNEHVVARQQNCDARHEASSLRML